MSGDITIGFLDYAPLHEALAPVRHIDAVRFDVRGDGALVGVVGWVGVLRRAVGDVDAVYRVVLSQVDCPIAG